MTQSAVGDLNGDGRDDVIAWQGSALAWILGGPAGTFGAPSVFNLTAGDSIEALAPIVDYTGDGIPDVAFGHRVLYTGPQVPVIMPGLGNGQLGFPVQVAPPSGTINDGAFIWRVEAIPNGGPEIVVSHIDSTAPWSSRIEVLGSLGTGFQPLAFYSYNLGGTWWIPSQIGDLNGDGLADLVGLLSHPAYNSASQATHVFVLPGIPASPYFGGPLTFLRPNLGSGSLFMQQLRVGDVNNDGLADVVVPVMAWPTTNPNYISYAVALGQAQSVLGPWITSSPTDDNTQRIHLHDFDGDGNLDVLRARNLGTGLFNASWHFHRGDGLGSFAPAASWGGFPGFSFTAAADADGDGDKDLVALYTPTTSVCFNEGRIGAGTPASSGLVPRISRGLAALGNPGFHVSLEQAPPLAPLLLAASRARVNPVPASQIVLQLYPTLLLWPLGALGPSLTDAQGRATLPIPLPPDPALSGLVAFVQWAIADPLLPQGFALSQASQVILY